MMSPFSLVGVDSARRRFGKVDGDFAVGGDRRENDSDTEIGSRLSTLAVLGVDLDAPGRAAENNRAVVGARDQLIEIGLRNTHAVVLLGGDRQPAGDAPAGAPR